MFALQGLSIALTEQLVFAVHACAVLCGTPLKLGRLHQLVRPGAWASAGAAESEATSSTASMDVVRGRRAACAGASRIRCCESVLLILYTLLTLSSSRAAPRLSLVCAGSLRNGVRAPWPRDGLLPPGKVARGQRRALRCS